MAEGHLSAGVVGSLVWAPERGPECLLTRSRAPLCPNEALLNVWPFSSERRGGETLLCFRQRKPCEREEEKGDESQPCQI